MIKTLKEYQELGYPEDYLKNGDPIDMPLARYLTGMEDIDDHVGCFTSPRPTGICGDELTKETISRTDYAEPYIYIGETIPDGYANRNPKHARKIFVCSPFRACTEEELEQNISIAKKACRIIIMGGDFPIAPHLYFPSFLQDDVKTERSLGIEYGLYLLDQCDEMVVITLGTEKVGYPRGPLTEGMRAEVYHAVERGMRPKFVSLDEIWKITMS